MTLRSACRDSLRTLARLAIVCVLFPVGAAADQIVVRDRFDGAALSGHRPDTNLPNSAWSATGSGAALWGQRAWAAGADWAGILATIDSGVADGRVAVDWTPGGDMPYGAVVARAADPANYLIAYYWSGALSLARVTSSGQTVLASTPIADPGSATHRLTLVLAGSSIEVWYDGVRRLSASDAFNVAVTRHGFRWLSHYDWLSTYGNFEVSGTYVPPAATVAVTPSPVQVSLFTSATLTATAYDAAHGVIPGMNFSWASSNPSAVAVVSVGATTASAMALGGGTATITATPTHGPSGAATVTVDTGTVAVLDTFTGANNTSLSAHTPDVHLPTTTWSVSGSGVTLDGNHARAGGADWNPVTALIDSGIADGTIGIDWTPAGSNPAAALIARASSATNYLTVVYWSRMLSLFRVSEGSSVLLGQTPVADPLDATHRVELKLAGADIEVWWDRVQQIVASDPVNATATRHGFRWYSFWDWQSTFDRFEVSALPAIASVTVSPAGATIPMNGGRVLTAQAFDSTGVVVPGVSFSWRSSNVEVASVRAASSTSGAVVAEGVGQAGITAVAFGDRARASVDVTVTPPPRPVSQNPAPCAFSLWPGTGRWAGDGGSGGFDVTTTDACTWTALTGEPWIHVSTTEGQGSETVRFSVEPNPTAASRTGTIAVGGYPSTVLYTVTQSSVDTTAGRETNPTTCGTTRFRWAPERHIAVEGGASAIEIDVPQACSWTAETQAGWIALERSSGVGPAVLQFKVAPNSSVDVRFGTFTVNNRPVLVTQEGALLRIAPQQSAELQALSYLNVDASGCEYSVYPDDVILPSIGGTAAVRVASPTWCDPSVLVNVPWLSVSKADEQGYPLLFRVFVTAARNDGSARSARVTIGNRIVVVTQNDSSDGGGPEPGIVWNLTPDADRVGQCLGNCGGGCGSVLAVCGGEQKWHQSFIAPPVFTGRTTTKVTCREGTLVETQYDVYSARAHFEYRGRFSNGCFVHDALTRANFVLGGIGSLVVLPYDALICQGSTDYAWPYDADVFGLRAIASVQTGEQCGQGK